MSSDINHSFRHVVFALLVIALPSGCTLSKHRDFIEDGVLMSGLNRQAFLDEWGPPTRTYTVTGDEISSGQLGIFRGSYFHGKETYDVWDYESRETKLVFRGLALVSWATARTVEQLREQD